MDSTTLAAEMFSRAKVVRRNIKKHHPHPPQAESQSRFKDTVCVQKGGKQGKGQGRVREGLCSDGPTKCSDGPTDVQTAQQMFRQANKMFRQAHNMFRRPQQMFRPGRKMFRLGHKSSSGPSRSVFCVFVHLLGLPPPRNHKMGNIRFLPIRRCKMGKGGRAKCSVLK